MFHTITYLLRQEWADIKEAFLDCFTREPDEIIIYLEDTPDGRENPA